MTAPDNSSSRERWSNPRCLHCTIVDTIYGYFDDKGEKIDGETQLDIQEISEHAGQVLAEFFASEPDKRKRDRRLKELFRATRDMIPTIRARGDGAYPKQRLQ